ncbi:MAG: hypothetical protein ACYTEQ_05675 [Planctomycetota bacterium]|jgi:hypothetical protein
MKNGSLINRAHCRHHILEMAKVLRPGWHCRRVSGEALDEIDAKLRTMINGLIRSHPTVGVTFKLHASKRKKD